MTTARVLPLGEWARLDETDLRASWRRFDPAVTHVCVLEEDGVIVGRWVIQRIWHVEGFYLHRPHLFRRLWRLVGETLRALHVDQVWTAAAPDDSLVHTMLARAGATPIPIDHFVLQVRLPAEEPICLSLP